MDDSPVHLHPVDGVGPSALHTSNATNGPQRANTLSTNRFKDAESLTELINQLVAAGSSCWAGGADAANFDTDQAQQIAAEAKERLAELGLASFG